jgi:hypothetical protein
MQIILVVTQAFGPHAKGDHIADPVLISETLASEYSGHVVRIQVPITTAQEH